MKKNYLVFDFDGTIADTLYQVVAITNYLAEEYGFKHIDPDDVPLLRHKTSQEMIKYLNIPLMKIPKLMKEAKKLLHETIHTTRPIHNIKPALETLHDIGFKLGILSSNASNNIEEFLKENKMDYFAFVQSTSKIWGKNKAIRNLLKSKNIDASDVVYIGDETRDIEAAKKAGIDVIGVSWGFNSKDTLAKHSPTYLIENPEEFLTIAQKIK